MTFLWGVAVGFALGLLVGIIGMASICTAVIEQEREAAKKEVERFRAVLARWDSFYHEAGPGPPDKETQALL